MDIKADGSGISFGSVSQKSGMNIAWENMYAKKMSADSLSVGTVEAAIINSTDMSAECVYAEQLLINNQDVTDYIIETGISVGKWYYRKWASGIYECWKSVNYAYTSNYLTASGSLYYYTTAGQSYPVMFAEAPCLTLTIRGSGSTFAVRVKSSNSNAYQTGDFQVYAASKTDDSGGYINMYAIGKI